MSGDMADLPAAAPAEHTQATEVFPANGSAELAQRLFDSGLLFLLNSAVLHHHGLAFGVMVDDSTGRVVGLSLHETSDPDGFWYDEPTTVHARRKLTEAGLR